LNRASDQCTQPTPVPVARLAVTRVQLTNFRSYANAELAVSGRPVVLAGPNGAGKTNILDAISLLAPGRGLRGAKLSEHIRRGPSAPSEALWAVAATVSRGADSYDIGTGLTTANGGERRAVRLNGAAAQSSADLGEIVQMTWLTPAMDRLFAESASGRRRFLDRLVLGFDPGHARRSVRYETAMRERARLLKFGPRDPLWLDGLEAEMAEAGTVATRAAFPAPSSRWKARPTPCSRSSAPIRNPRCAPCSPARASPTRKAAIRPSARTAAIWPCAIRISARTPENAPPASRRRY
jgi:DNA replication and repair protein RecF